MKKILVIALLALALGLSACGSSQQPPSAYERMNQALERLEKSSALVEGQEEVVRRARKRAKAAIADLRKEEAQYQDLLK